MTIFETTVGVLAVLPYSYFGSNITYKIQHTAVATFESRWYELPLKMQKNIKRVIEFGQIKRRVSGYSLFNCDLEGFIKVKTDKNN